MMQLVWGARASRPQFSASRRKHSTAEPLHYPAMLRTSRTNQSAGPTGATGTVALPNFTASLRLNTLRHSCVEGWSKLNKMSRPASDISQCQTESARANHEKDRFTPDIDCVRAGFQCAGHGSRARQIQTWRPRQGQAGQESQEGQEGREEGRQEEVTGSG